MATITWSEGQNLNFAIPVSKLISLLAKISSVRPLMPRPRLAFDGLYGASFPLAYADGGEIIEWFRFHEDGSVFMTSTKPGLSLNKVFDWLGQRSGIERYHGRHVVLGSDIEFTMYLGTDKASSYSGTIQCNGLRLVEHLTNGSETRPHEYRFVKVTQ